MRGGKFRFRGGFDSISDPVPFGKNEELSGCLGAGGKAGKIKVGLGCPGPCRLLSPSLTPEPRPARRYRSLLLLAMEKKEFLVPFLGSLGPRELQKIASADRKY